MTIVKKRQKATGDNHIISKGTLDGTPSVAKKKRWAEIARKPRVWS